MDFPFNIALGRIAEFYNRVDQNDPTNSALILLVLALSGLENDETLREKETVTALVAGTTNEVTNTGYSRKTLTDTDLVAMTVDHANNWRLLDIADQTFATITAGDAWAKLVMAYDNDTTGGTDTNLIPMCAFDLEIAPDGTDVVIQIAFAGFWKGLKQ